MSPVVDHTPSIVGAREQSRNLLRTPGKAVVEIKKAPNALPDQGLKRDGHWSDGKRN